MFVSFIKNDYYFKLPDERELNQFFVIFSPDLKNQKQMKLKSNIGTADRTIRLLIAIVLIILFYTEVLPGIFGVIGLILALLLTVTSLITFCPLYKVLNLNSIFNKEKNQTKSKA